MSTKELKFLFAIENSLESKSFEDVNLDYESIILKMDKKLLSIVIPSYNSENTIRKANKKHF